MKNCSRKELSGNKTNIQSIQKIQIVYRTISELNINIQLFVLDTKEQKSN